MREMGKLSVIVCIITIFIFLSTVVTFAANSNVPPFIKVGGIYEIRAGGMTGQDYKVVEVDNSGWIKVYPADGDGGTYYWWINLNTIDLIRIRPINK